MAEINKLKVIRRNTKGGLTRTLNTIERLLTDNSGDAETLKGYISKAEDQFKQVESKHTELVANVTDEAAYEEEEKWMGECEQGFVDTIVRARKLIGSMNQGVPTTSQPVIPSTPLSSTTSATQETVQHVETVSTPPRPTSPVEMSHDIQPSLSRSHSSGTPKMQKMKFPTFNGDIKEYQRFRTLFTHCAADLTEIECFYQLTQSMMNSRERNMIKGCINVQRAWQVLDEKYGDQDRVVDNLLQDLENLKPYQFKGKVSLSAMTSFVQTLQVFEMQAETIGLSGELNSKIMLSQIKQKMPEEHRIAYYKSVRDEHSSDSLGGLVKWLHGQLLLQEKAKSPYPEKPNSTEIAPGRSTKASNAATWNQSRQQNQSQEKQSSRGSKCALHPNSNTHFLKTCMKFRNLSLKDKYDTMKKHNICHRCGHNNCRAGKPPFDLSSCQFPSPCKVQTCGSDAHFPAICPIVYGNDAASTSPPMTDPPDHLNANVRASRPDSRQANVSTTTGTPLSGILPTVMAYLRIGNTRHLVRILLDGGSQATLIRKGILPRMEHDRYQDHELTLVGGKTISRKLRLIDCNLEDLESKQSYRLTMTEIDKPCGDAPITQPEDLNRYDHLRGIEISTASSTTIDVLLGVDNTYLMIWEEYVRGRNSQDPIAVRCPLGWFIQGGRFPGRNPILNYLNIAATGPLEELIGLETAGLEPRRCHCSEEALNKSATELMQKSVIQLPEGEYQVALPWKKAPDDLPDNYTYAVKRLKSLEHQFANRPEEWEIYCRQMRDQVKRGVSRHVSKAELQKDRSEGRKMWFLPHFAVTKDSKSTPVRVVYDAKARFQGHSLNEYLMKGDNINNDIFDVALRFRENEVGVIADISKMFQAIRIGPDDARFHRFIFREKPSDPIEVYELRTVTFGDKPSPTAAIVTLRHVVEEHAQEDEQLRKVITDQFYMDDLNESVAHVEEARDLKVKLTETLRKGKFAIRKWQSNAKVICDESEDDSSATVLGTKWDLSEDTLKVKEVKPCEDVPTKRNILGQLASYYDVFGILSGILVRPKILLQKLWQLNFDWDTPLERGSTLYTMLDGIYKDLQQIDGVEIPRCLIPMQFKGVRPLPEISLHGACDASEDAMGMAIWLRWAHPEDTCAHLSFVCARARVTPLKQLSIPRKELQALLLLSRLMLTVKNALRFQISYSRIWTDSMTAINWLRGQSKAFRSYVAYRVGEITTEFDPHKDISYVPSTQNPADIISRGGTTADMQRVIQGPEFLKKPPHCWPETPVNIPDRPNDEERKKKHFRNAKKVSVNAVSSSAPVVAPEKYSSWPRLKMITARVLSLKDLPKKEWLKHLTRQIAGRPTGKHIKEAELYWIRQAQRDLDLTDPNIMKLDPFFDTGDQVYRVGGRIDKAPLSYDIRHPYLLPKKSHISLLIVRDRHIHSLHGGSLRTASEVRKNFWIIGDMNISKRVVHDCTTCKRHRSKPMHQKMAELPEFRVRPQSPPFATTLVDYLGPVAVKVSRNTSTKGYCAVFSCSVTRAIHLTCVPDLSTEAFLQALERFISIRGAPNLLISDNATCFRGADNTMNDLNLKLDQAKVKEHSQLYKMDWKFGPPGGPHHQGAVERMVQEVKKAMKHLVKADRLTFAEWETVFCLISGLINSRPLTAMSSSPLDEPPLTPNHFLIGRGDLSSPDVPCEEYVGNPRKRRELCNSMVDGFWKRWMQCIHKLSPRKKWVKSTENLAKSDIVLVVGEDKKRGSWKMAEVVDIFSGEDDFVRVVDVRFADGHIARKPITKLILLMKNEERTDLC